MRSLVAILTLAVLAAASPAGAQVDVGMNIEGGMHWAVAAPQGASWRLVCRHPPVIYHRSNYDQRAWTNRLTREGDGPANGRLPLNQGDCRLTKTGGDGPVGIALVRPGERVAKGVRGVGETAAVGFL